MLSMEAFFSPWFPWLALLLGLLIGSFINVLIYRLPLMLSQELAEDSQSSVNLWWPPSHCPRCQHNIMPWDNIPVLSWLFLKGKCRHCQCKISFIYPLSEAVTGVIFFLLVYCLYPEFSLLQLAFIALLLCLLYALAVIDLNTFLLPDSLVFLLLWCGLIASVRHIIPISPRDSVMGAAFIWCFTWMMSEGFRFITRRDGFGRGDMKLFAACAVWLGNANVGALMLGSAVLGLAFFFIRHALKRYYLPQDELARQGYIPFGPAIALMTVYLLCSEVLHIW